LDEILLALINAFIGALIVSLVFGGIIDQPVDSVVKVIIVTGQSLFTSAFLGGILINIVNKGIGILVLYAIDRWISMRDDPGITV
jgi:energy-coupling factor transport system substrate-specific component